MPTDNEWLRLIYTSIAKTGGLPTSVVSGIVGLDEATLAALEQITVSSATLGNPSDQTASSLTLFGEPATAYSIIQLLKAIVVAVDGLEPTIGTLNLTADQLQLNTDTIEALITAVRDRLPALLEGGRLKVDAGNTIDVPVNTSATWRSLVVAPNTIDGATGKRAWVVTAGKEWQLQGVCATFTTSATAGDRRLELVCNPGLNSLVEFRFRHPVGVDQAASLTHSYHWGMGQPYFTAVVASTIVASISPIIMPPSTCLYVWDRNQVSPVTDTWANVFLLAMERSV